MDRYVTLGADEDGQVYGLEVGTDNDWMRNSLGYSTSCVVIRPVNRETYQYMTEDPQSAKEIWQQVVAADQTELGLEDWFREYCGSNDVFDMSFVYGLLDDDDNPTVSKHKLSIKKRIDEDGETDKSDYVVSSDGIWDEDGQPMSFRRRVELALVESDDVASVDDVNDVCHWESAGFFPPKKPFVVEFAPKKLLKEYYAHLRKTYKEFKV